MTMRLEAVLRAGKTHETATGADGECLTRALKRTSLVPTGACLPRGFDPDYCAYDRYYTLGLSLVSTMMTALIAAGMPDRMYESMVDRIRDTLGSYCHTPNHGWVYDDTWDFKEQDALPSVIPPQYRETSKQEARQDFSKLCAAMDESLAAFQPDGILSRAGKYTAGRRNVIMNLRAQSRPMNLLWNNLIHALRDLVCKLVFPSAFLLGKAANDNIQSWIEKRDWLDTGVTYLVRYLWAKTSAKYISRYMNEYTLMIASFFRVNAKNLRTGKPLMVNLNTFAQQCRADIVNGPNTPPTPPTVEELAAAWAYTESEKRRQADLVDEVMKMPTVMASYE